MEVFAEQLGRIGGIDELRRDEVLMPDELERSIGEHLVDEGLGRTGLDDIVEQGALEVVDTHTPLGVLETAEQVQGAAISGGLGMSHLVQPPGAFLDPAQHPEDLVPLQQGLRKTGPSLRRPVEGDGAVDFRQGGLGLVQVSVPNLSRSSASCFSSKIGLCSSIAP